MYGSKLIDSTSVPQNLEFSKTKVHNSEFENRSSKLRNPKFGVGVHRPELEFEIPKIHNIKSKNHPKFGSDSEIKHQKKIHVATALIQINFISLHDKY